MRLLQESIGQNTRVLLVQVTILWILSPDALVGMLGEEMPQTNAIRAFLFSDFGLKGKCRCSDLTIHLQPSTPASYAWNSVPLNNIFLESPNL